MATTRRDGSGVRTFGLILFAALLASCGTRDDSKTQHAEPASTSRPSFEEASEFSLSSLDGDTFRLSDHRGEVIALNFWATWCAPCRDEIPAFIRMQNELGEEGLQFVGISLDEEGEAIVQPFVKEFGINYPIMVNDGAVAETYGGHYVVPTTFVIDRAGLIRHRLIGASSLDDLERAIKDLLEEAPAS